MRGSSRRVRDFLDAEVIGIDRAASNGESDPKYVDLSVEHRARSHARRRFLLLRGSVADRAGPLAAVRLDVRASVEATRLELARRPAPRPRDQHLYAGQCNVELLALDRVRLSDRNRPADLAEHCLDGAGAQCK